MGIQDRDYMREKRLRWDERSGEMRLDETPAHRSTSRGQIWVVVVLAAFAAAGGWSWWRAQPVAGPGSSGDGNRSAPPGSPCVQDWVPDGPVLEGRVSAVTDADTITVALSSGPIKVRLHSIDALERNQPGGPEARAALAQRLRGADVALEPIEQDQYDRMVAVVYVGEANVNAWLVCEGHAWVHRQYARDPRYCEAEMAARSGRRGVWARPAAEQRAPWEWRAVKSKRRVGFSDYSGETLERCVAALGKRPEAARDARSSGSRESPQGPSRGRDGRERASRDGSTACPAGDCRLAGEASAPQALLDAPSASPSAGLPEKCRIMGNISRYGKIYHVPGTAAYAKTKIDESQGERWFCSEAEAKAAGWRAPRG
jgi:endonuclease YncB( thermonuclease family)